MSDFNFQEWDGKLLQFHRSDLKNKQSEVIVECRIDRAGDFWQVLSDIRSKYKPYEKELPMELWFRGHKDEKFVLLPHLIRRHHTEKIKYSLPQYQRILFEKFLARSRNSVELGAFASLKRGTEQIEYIADMQHYSVPTNLLDWSENVGVSLYFATEEEESHKMPDRAAAIYVLQPYLYNLVRNRVINLYLEKPHEERYIHNRSTANYNIGTLPNFSAHYNVNAKEYENYVFGPQIWNLPGPNDFRLDPYVNEEECYKVNAPLLPLAITVSRNNPRILNQRGTFLAFNLCEYPMKEGDDRFLSYGHVELSQIQNFYLKSEQMYRYEMTRRDETYQIIRNKVPFLYKIIIEPSAILDLRELAVSLGNKKTVVYPELYHIGEEISMSVS